MRPIDSALGVVQDIIEQVGPSRAVPTFEEFMAMIRTLRADKVRRPCQH